MLPATHWIEKDGSFTNSGRWAQWKEQVLPPEGEARHDHWILAELFDAGARRSTGSRAASSRSRCSQLTMPYKDPRKPELDEIAQEINGKDLDHRQAAGHVRRAQGRRHHDGRRLDLHRALPGERQPGQAPRRHPGPGKATTRPAWATTRTGPGAGRSTAACSTTARRPTRWAAVGPEAARHPVGRGAGKWVGDVPDYPATADPTEPERPAAVHHDRRGHRAAVQQRRGRRAVPRALRADRVADRQPAAPEQSRRRRSRSSTTSVAGRPNRFGTVDGVPVRRHVATGSPSTSTTSPSTSSSWCSCSPRRSSRCPAELAQEKGIATGDRVRVSSKRGKLEVARGRDEAPGPAARSTARRSTRSASRSTGASSASTPGSTGWPTRSRRSSATPARGRPSSRRSS